MKFPPAAANASRIANEVGSSAVQPNTLPPNMSGETRKLVLPKERSCMMHLHFEWLRCRNMNSACSKSSGTVILILYERPITRRGLRPSQSIAADLAGIDLHN